MSFPRKLAHCELLAKFHGVDTSREDWTVRQDQAVMCDQPWDCSTCKLFNDHLDQIGVDQPAWICGLCVSDTAVSTWLMFYDSGFCSVCGHEGSILSAVVLGE